MYIFVENNYSQFNYILIIFCVILLGSRNEFLLFLQSRCCNILLQSIQYSVYITNVILEVTTVDQCDNVQRRWLCALLTSCSDVKH